MTVKAGDRVGLVGKERRCKICGKPFIIYDSWVYKKTSGGHEIVFCSWGCLRKFEKTHGNKAELREAIVTALSAGKSVKEVSELLAEDPRKVLYWAKKMGVGT